jgi:microcystin degradation protein MlrC
MTQATPPRAFIAGWVHETNTFSPVPASRESFEPSTYRPGDGPFVPPPHIDTLGYGHFARLCQQAGIELRAGLYTHTGPSAALNARDHAAMRAEILAGLERAMPVDRVLLFMHGAQIAQGCDDVEGDLLQAIRQRVGPAVPVAVLLDLHANITPAMLRNATFCVGCLEYPHTDYEVRAQQVFDLVQAAVGGRTGPRTLAWRMPLVGLFRTTEGPMRDFVAALRAAHLTAGVLSISAFHGFPLGDTPHTGATLVISTDGHLPAALELGASLAQQYIDAALSVPNPPGLDAALDDALSGPAVAGAGPVVFADSGDNPGGGAAGDSTFVLEALLQRGLRHAALGMLWDPVAADFAHSAGVGATLKLRLGGKVSALSGRPLDVQAEVLCVRDDARQALFAQGEPKARLGRSAALRVQGIDIVVNSLRQQVFDPRCFTEHGIELSTKRLVVVKGSTHFVNGFAALARRIVFCASPGSVSLDATLFDYQRIQRPLYPLDPGFTPVATLMNLDQDAP